MRVAVSQVFRRPCIYFFKRIFLKYLTQKEGSDIIAPVLKSVLLNHRGIVQW